MAVRLQSNKSTISLRDDIDLPPFSEVLLITKDEEGSREDKRILRRTGFRSIQNFSSGVDAIRYILGKRKNTNFSYSCLVISHEQLNDMDAITLISLLRLHPQGSVIPVLAVISPEIASSSTVPLENRKEKYSSLGVFATLVRPLTPNDISVASQGAYDLYVEMDKKRKALLTAVEKATDNLKLRYSVAEQEKTKIFELTIARFSFGSPATMSYEEAYNEGCEKLTHKLYDQAWRYFKRAIAADSPYKAHALFGLYQLYKERQELGNAKLYLIQACQAYIDDGAWDRVEECVMRFSQEFSKYPHPILGIITTAIKRSDMSQLDSLLRVSKAHLSHEEISRSIVTGCFHYELSQDIMNVLGSDVELFTRVSELLQERRLDRQVREQQIALQKAVLEQTYANSIKTKNSFFTLGKDTRSEGSALPTDITMKKSQNGAFFDLENPDQLLEKQQVRLGIGSKGSIESLPITLSEGNKGSLFGDIVRIARQTAKIYRESK